MRGSTFTDNLFELPKQSKMKMVCHSTLIRWRQRGRLTLAALEMVSFPFPHSLVVGFLLRSLSGRQEQSSKRMTE